MSYETLVSPAVIKGLQNNTTAFTVVTSTGVREEFVCFKPCAVRRIAYCITTASTVTATVIAFKKRPTPGSASSESTLGTLTIPTTAAIGAVYYKDLDDDACLLAEGDSLAIDVTTSSTAGAGVFGFQMEDSPESHLNNAEMIASA